MHIIDRKRIALTEFAATPVGQAVRRGGIAVTCPCGHADTIEAFGRTEIGGTLPATDYQCPACGRAVRKRFRHEHEFTPDGRILSPGGWLEPIAARL